MKEKPEKITIARKRILKDTPIQYPLDQLHLLPTGIDYISYKD